MKKWISWLLVTIICLTLLCGSAFAEKIKYLYDDMLAYREKLYGTTLFISVPTGWEEHTKNENGIYWNIFTHPSAPYMIQSFACKLSAFFSQEIISAMDLGDEYVKVVLDALSKSNALGASMFKWDSSEYKMIMGGKTRCRVFSGEMKLSGYWFPTQAGAFIYGSYLMLILYTDADSMLTKKELADSFERLLYTISTSKSVTYTPPLKHTSTLKPTAKRTATPKPTAKPTATPKPTNTPTPAPTEIPVLVAPDGSWTCYNCGRAMKTNFCTHCGAARPTPIPTPTPVPTPAPWICPECGIVNNDRFCGNCGTQNPDYVPLSIEVGDIVTFGHYPQTAEGTDETPIEWIVLDVNEENNKTLLISRYGLDIQPYNIKPTYINWETCSLRGWLNDTFLNIAFNEVEQAKILLTNVNNDNSQGNSAWKTTGGENTEDLIFLLSYAEAIHYFSTNNERQCIPTSYVTSRKEWKKSETSYAIWWLRSPGANQYCTGSIITDGSASYHSATYYTVCVRPAMWIETSSYLFGS